jgi:hypothetical protein
VFAFKIFVWVACKVLCSLEAKIIILGFSLSEIWEKMEDDLEADSLKLDGYTKNWCWKQILTTDTQFYLTSHPPNFGPDPIERFVIELYSTLFYSVRTFLI